MKEVLEKEIEVCEKAMESMNETITKCEQGIKIQSMVMEKFIQELQLCTSTS